MHGTGYIHERPTIAQLIGSTRRSFRVGGSFVPTNRSLLVDVFGNPFDQRGTESCVGMWLAKAITMTVEHNGGGRMQLSAFAPYFRGRLRRQASVDDLTDTGMRVSDGVWSVNLHGCPPEATWPSWSLGSVSQRVAVNRWPSDRNAAAYDGLRIKTKVKRIVATGSRLSQRIADSLEKNQVIGVAIPTGAEFRRGKGILGPQTLDNWHMVALLDFRFSPAGDYEFLIGNSWGDDWGEDGKCWASRELIEQSKATYYVESAVLS